MNHLLRFAIVAILCGGCDSSPSSTQSKKTDAQIKVPAFTVRITLDPQAAVKLADAGETIAANLIFDGEGTPQKGAKTAPHRAIILGRYAFELQAPGAFVVEDATLSPEAYSRLSDKNYHFTINVFSGRRHFGNNVLAGGYAQGRLADIQAGEIIEISCTLL